MTHGDLFAGIGGFALAARWCGIKTIWAVEIDPYCQAVYRKHFPSVEIYGDVKEIKGLPYIDLLTGGFPCQPFSVAGKQKGTADDRYLWPEMLRIIQLVNPRWIIAENVPGIDDKTYMVLDTVLSDLEDNGYQAIPIEIPACAVGAPHRRQRVWIVAYTSSTRRQDTRSAFSHEEAHGRTRWNLCEPNSHNLPSGEGKGSRTADVAHPTGYESRGVFLGPFSPDTCSDGNRRTETSWWTTEPNVGRVAHGVPARVDRLRTLGNAIVPQVAERIMRAILESEP